MIYNMVFVYFQDERLVKQPEYERDAYGYARRPLRQLTGGTKAVGYYTALKEQLENSEDIFLWTYSKDQKNSFDGMVEKAGLEKFIVFQSPMVTNPNYNERRVAMCIMKGAKRNEEATAESDAGL